MSQVSGVTILQNNVDSSEYVIRDKNNINIGRFNIIELDSENRHCTIKLKFYRENDYILLKDTLKKILKAIFNDVSINKVNIITSDSMSLGSFLDLGFIIEGIFTDNIYHNATYRDEIAMGINRSDYSFGEKISILELQSENITLRNLTPDDSEALLNYYDNNKNHLAAFEPSRDNSFYTLDVQRSILNESYRHFMTGVSVDFGVFKEDKLIGKLKLSNIVNGVFKNAILGYSMDSKQQGKGYMKEAVKLVVDYAFDELDLHRVEASVLINNEKSKRVLKACGFKELGVNEKYLFINGAWRDHITYYIVRE